MRKGYHSLIFFRKSFVLAVRIHNESKSFPAEEKYALTDQIRRSSRSICSNLAEGYRKRRYPEHFITKITDAHAECPETMVWLDFALAFRYLTEKSHAEFTTLYEEVGKMLFHMEHHPENYI